jgi:hypothetical protein
MAGQGPAPKARRGRRPAPGRGDWVILDPLTKRVLPELSAFDPPEGLDEWSTRSTLLWNAWATDPVTALWSESDLLLAVETMYLQAADPVNKAPEIRLRMESLMLGPKGRRDARLSLPDEGDKNEPVARAHTPAHAIPEAI